MATADNPSTGLFYVLAQESCNIFTKSSAWWEPGKSVYGGSTRLVSGETSEKVLRAIDVQTGRIAWEIPQTGNAGTWSGVLSTAGGSVLFGDESGAFAAVDARSGKPLWHLHLNQSWHASPMTYMIDEKQYVAIAVGSNNITFGLPE
jgi:alcohol dehydrogenase (cytochrome c)